MNVGIFADCYRPTISGVVTSIRQLREGLARRGHRAVVVTVATPHYHETDAPVYRFPSLPFNTASGFRLGVVSQRAVHRLVRAEGLDLIHTHTEYSLGWAGRRAARAAGLPLVHTAHTMHTDYRHYLFFGRWVPDSLVHGYLRRFLSGYDCLVCPSEKARETFQAFVPGLQKAVVGNGICRVRFRPEVPVEEEKARVRRALGIGPGERVVLYAGRIAREKRVLELLAALVPLLRARPEVKVLFVGRGPLEAPLAAAAAGWAVGRQVVLAGDVAWEQMHRFYVAADLFATASLSEMQPMTLIEASLCGLPAVVRRERAYAGLVRDGYNGYQVERDGEMAGRIAELLGDEARRQALAGNALALSAEFSAERHVAQMEALYRRLIDDRSSGGG